MIFKKNNPGCPCCECPCYKFNDNAEDSTGNKHLTATSEAYADGILGRAGSFTGSSHYTHAHDDCFSPAASDGVWRMWFWFKKVTEPTDNAHEYHGIITKGSYSSEGSPAVTSFDGEWGVFYKFGGSGDSIHFVYKSNLVALGVMGGSQAALDTWYFLHFQINHTTKACDFIAYFPSGSDVICPTLGCTSTPNILGDMSVTDTPLRIGNNTGTNGQILGANGGALLIDNVGFSNKPGTAVNLYNSGVGKACPNQGK